MDEVRFDQLSKTVAAHRRPVLGGLLAGLLLSLQAVARNKTKKRKSSSRGKKRASAQAEFCWRAGACIVKKGANVSQCNLAGYTAPPSLNCTGCNISRANLRAADLTGANFTRANLSGACLIDADFTGATFTNSTNLYNAIFCNTTMPDGSVNNSGCNAGTACCSICTTSCTGGKIPNPETCECECPPPACTGVRTRNPETCACECPPPPSFQACINTSGCIPVTTSDGCQLCGTALTCDACPSGGCPGADAICVLGCANPNPPFPVCGRLCPGF